MADKNLTPEKRLLKIIEEQKGKDPAPSPLRTGKKYFSLASLRARLAFFRDKLKQKKTDTKKTTVDLKAVNVFLQLMIVCLVISLGVGMKIDFDAVNKEELFTVPKASTDVLVEPTAVASLLKPQMYYLEKTRGRNLFQFADVRTEPLVNFKEGEKDTISKIGAITADLKLVGISWSDDPDAIIENTRLEKTYFVKKGYMIDQIRVHDVLKDKVILRYQGDEVELR